MTQKRRAGESDYVVAFQRRGVGDDRVDGWMTNASSSIARPARHARFALARLFGLLSGTSVARMASASPMYSPHSEARMRSSMAGVMFAGGIAGTGTGVLCGRARERAQRRGAARGAHRHARSEEGLSLGG